MRRGVSSAFIGVGALVGAALALGGSHDATRPQPALRGDGVRATGAGRPAETTRAATWCGTTSSADRPNAVAGYPVHVLYVYPADGTDRSADWAPQIEGWIEESAAWWQRQDPYHVPRFDMYSAPCGLQVDIEVFHSGRLSVATTDAANDTAMLWSELNTRPGAHFTKYLAFVDQIDTGNWCGWGDMGAGETIGSLNMGLADVYLGSRPCSGTSRSNTLAHEFVHTISPDAGFPNAPHVCPGNILHFCDSTGDLMYPGLENGISINSIELDVGHDDYYGDHAPYDLQNQPWLRKVQQQQHLALTLTGQGTVTSDVPGVSCSATCGSDWDAGSPVTLTAAAAAGQRFVRWTGACDSLEPTCSVTMNGATNVTAQFAPASFGVTVSISGTGSVRSEPRGISCSRSACTAQFPSFEPISLTAVAPKGWKFKAWSGGCHGTKTTCMLPMSSAAAVHAAFVKARPKPKKR
jgi:Divergent InlB B-repeat domain